ncbi:hypothetical protein Cni_G18464 [Canna indica]|uniref:Uncharacterized protein n=1 Tax=Canna indica TaxID=4628 RepID=A0AAQ3QED5_9LILI|nr:hypothetical protein Cni_G18464 [Canna indica]
MEVSAAPAISPSSDKQLWSRLRDRVDSILEDRSPKASDPPASSSSRVDPERGKRLREGSELLMRGFDSVSSSLSQLSSTLISTQQRVSDLAKPPVSDALLKESPSSDSEEPKSKKLCSSAEFLDKYEANSCNEHKTSSPNSSTEKKHGVEESNESSKNRDDKITSDAIQSAALKKAKTLAVMMATKASFLSRELKSIKSELSFMQERCNLLEEENGRLQEVVDKGLRPEEDDLVRLQLEALLAEKSRLANDNANLVRENQCLHQLVEYHQLTSDVSATYEQAINGMCSDFSFPLTRLSTVFDDEEEQGSGDNNAPVTPSTSKLGLFPSLDEHLEIHHSD